MALVEGIQSDAMSDPEPPRLDAWELAEAVSNGDLTYSAIAERMKDPTYAEWYEENFGDTNGTK